MYMDAKVHESRLKCNKYKILFYFECMQLMTKCLTCTDHISWYIYKKIMKPIFNETREAQLQLRETY